MYRDPDEDIRIVVEGELGDGIGLEDVFSEFEREPIGCASIARCTEHA